MAIPSYKNRVGMSVSGTPGTGTITLGSAESGRQSFATAYGANANVDVVIVDGTDWEVARDCTYTHSGTTLTRGTLEASSTGSALSLTSAAKVYVTETAHRAQQSLNLEHVAGSDADTTMDVGAMYVVDMSAWATADRTYTLPATAAVGDRVGIMITAGDASHELIIQANTGDTLNGVTAAEWSRLFITGEVVIMRCVSANATWVVEHDGRIPSSCVVRNDGTTQQSIGAATFVNLQAAVDDVVETVGDSWDNSTGRFTARRAGRYLVTGHAQLATVADTTSVITIIRKNGTDYAHLGRAYASAGSANPGAGGAFPVVCAVGDYVNLTLYNSNATNAYNTVAGAERVGFSVTEQL